MTANSGQLLSVRDDQRSKIGDRVTVIEFMNPSIRADEFISRPIGYVARRETVDNVSEFPVGDGTVVEAADRRGFIGVRID